MKNRTFFFTLIFTYGIIFLGLTASSQAASKKGRTPANPLVVPEGLITEAKNYRLEKESRSNQVVVVYQKEVTKKLPIIVFIHGGGWKSGDKDQMGWLCIEYAKRGYLAASISYRLISEAPFPACISDAKEAVRFIKTQCAENWPGDSNRIGVMGYSAGAHLALMIALTPEQKHFKSERYPKVDSSIQCAFGVSTPTDFVTRVQSGKAMKLFTEAQINDLLFLQNVSPLYQIHANQVPITMVHGTKDKIVLPEQYEAFEKACIEAKVDNFELHLAEGGSHTYFFKHKGHRKVMEAFFDQHLKH